VQGVADQTIVEIRRAVALAVPSGLFGRWAGNAV
jgi:hypothetical protein